VTKALENLKDELDVAMALTGVTDASKVPRSVILAEDLLKRRAFTNETA
jgi:isopentenyl diphosphate isomerase/L-lactate dehydrogenase-like FMN-dependent dehydrogenase